MNLLETKEETMETFKGYQIKGIDIDRLPELTEELTEKPDYNIYLLLEPIEEVPDDSIEISPKPSEIWMESFRSIYPRKLQVLENRVGSYQHIYMNLTEGNSLLDGEGYEYYISLQGFDIDGIAEHRQIFIDLVNTVNKQALSVIEAKVQEVQEKEKANEDFRKRAEQINADCFPGTPTPE